MIIRACQLPISLLVGTASIFTANAATLIFSEEFNSAEPPAALTTANTGLDGVFANNGSIDSVVSTVGTGSAALFTGATTAGSQSGAYLVEGALSSMPVMTMGFTIRMQTSTSGVFGIYAGNGNTVGNNLTNTNRNTSHMLWDLMINDSGQLLYTTSSGAIPLPDFIVSDNTNYEFLIQVNNTSSAVDGVAANSMSIYANGSLIGSGLALRAGTSTVTGFRMGARSTTTTGDLVAQVDDIRVWDGIQAIPEPSSSVLLLGAACLLLRRNGCRHHKTRGNTSPQE